MLKARLAVILAVAIILSSCRMNTNSSGMTADRIQRISDSVYVDIPNCEYEGGNLSVYSVLGNYPADLIDDIENSYYVNNLRSYEGLYDWTMWYEYENNNQYDPADEILFGSGRVGRDYEVNGLSADAQGFVSFLLENRLYNVERVDLDEGCRDLIKAFGMDESLFGGAYYCRYHSADGRILNKYNIARQIDGISVLDTSLVPFDSVYVSWGRYNGMAPYAGEERGIILSFACINDEGDIYAIDTHDYEILSTVEERITVKPLEECIDIFLEDISREKISGNRANPYLNLLEKDGIDTWVYYADLMYLPIALRNNSGEYINLYYLVPCWMLFYTQATSVLGGWQEIDGIIALNASTGENIYVGNIE